MSIEDASEQKVTTAVKEVYNLFRAGIAFISLPVSYPRCPVKQVRKFKEIAVLKC